jgi:hypothetical protein
MPQYSDKAFLLAQPALFGEIALTLWLVIRGSRPTPRSRYAAEASLQM